MSIQHKHVNSLSSASQEPSFDSLLNKFMVPEEIYEEDYEYLKRQLPLLIRNASKNIEETADQLEYPGSILYHLRPDKVTIEQIAKRIASDFPEKNTFTLEEVIGILLLWEFSHRRNRYFRRKKMFEE